MMNTIMNEKLYMSRLDDLYKAIETMRREHLSTADLEAKVSLAEE